MQPPTPLYHSGDLQVKRKRKKPPKVFEGWAAFQLSGGKTGPDGPWWFYGDESLLGIIPPGGIIANTRIIVKLSTVACIRTLALSQAISH